MTVLTDHPPTKKAVMKATGPHVQAFANFERDAVPRHEPAWLFPLRQAGLARFADCGFPTVRHEDWRFTNVAPLAALPFRPVLRPPAHAVKPADLERLAFARLPGDRLVFVDGYFDPALSRVAGAGGAVRVLSLREALRGDAAWLERYLTAEPGATDQAFAALNNAYFTDGAVVVAAAQHSEKTEPIQLLFVSTGAEEGRTSHPRNLIVAEPNSRLTVLEQYVSLGSAATVTNTVTDLIAGDRAFVEHLRFQDESEQAFHLGTLRATIGAGARLWTHSVALGARLSRQSIRTVLNGAGLEAVLNGLYVVTGERLADHHMVVEHAQPHGASHEYFNGILSDRARGVFHGRILVRPGAQKTDAKQTNKNILLSDTATANTKPQLEIYADDVKCTHGATIGQLNPESVFYLRSRGIPLETARRMLIHSFAGEIIERIQSVPIRDELDQLVWDRLERDEHVHLEG